MMKPCLRFLIMTAVAAGAFWAIAASKPAEAPKRPNIVFLLVDDLGIRDLACYGSDFHESPNIDRLASQGIRYTNAYASHPVCGPSRSAIVTGKFPVRLNLTKIGGAIPQGETSWPEILKQNGYATYFLGKWHMGDADSVLNNGFDVNIAGNQNGQPSSFYFPYKSEYTKQNVPGLEDGKPGDYLTDALTDKALTLLDKNGDRPFVLYFSYYNVHKPYVSNAQGKKEHVEYFKEKLKTLPATDLTLRDDVRGGYTFKSLRAQRNPQYAGQIKAVDDSVGRIMDKLKEMGVAENTLIIFTSDQGSMCTSRIGVSTADPYLFGKAFLFDGGLRVPFIVKWPGRTQPGTTNSTITIHTDIYPTVMDAVGLPQKPDQHLDGISIIDTFSGKILPFERTFYWAFPQDHSLGHKASIAIRKGPYKLIHWLENGATELYNVETDISESNDLSKQQPERTSNLLKELKDLDPMKHAFANFRKATK